MVKFRDIKPFTRTASYEIDVSWKYLESTLDNFNQSGLLDLDPVFQRAHVWTEEQQARYVEYILRNGKSSKAIYFNCADWQRGSYKPVLLVDGKQRLEAVRKFMRSELEIFNEFVFSDFTDNLDMTQAAFRFHVNDLKTYPEVLQWYLDINSGGVVHTDDELKKVRAILWEVTSPSYKGGDPVQGTTE